MNTFKKYSLAALSISLLMSAPAQAVGFAELYAQAGQYAQALWANRPSMPKISVPSVSMPAISLPKVSMPAISMPSMPKIAMPSRAQVEAGIEVAAHYAQKAEKLMAEYPKTVAATKIAAVAVPVTIAGGYLVKKAVNNLAEYQAQQFAALNAHLNAFQQKYGDNSPILAADLIDKDLIDGMKITAIKILADAQAQINECVEKRADKVPKALHFEENLSRYLTIVPSFLPELQKEWNAFIKLAIAYDNANHTAFGLDLVASFEKVIVQLAPLNELINQ